MRSQRFLGPTLMVGLLISAYLAWRPTSGPSDGDADERRVRGGQLVATIRAEPRSFNRLASRDQTADLVAFLTQGRLVRINRASFELEPWLAQRWESSADGRTHTFFLRQDVVWSDGVSFTASDVLFSLDAVFDPRANSVLSDSLRIGGQPIRASSPDPYTVVVSYPAPSGIGARLLDNLVVLPRHRLEPALKAGTFESAWNTSTPPAEIAGTGPFVLREYQPGQRLLFERNPRYWRRAEDGEALPYLDRVVLEIVPDQNAELLRLTGGGADLTSSELRPQDYVSMRRAEEDGRVSLLELGVSTDADAFWFCLKPEARRGDPRFAFLQRAEFRRAISHAVDREAFADAVFLGAAVPIWGPVTPGNRLWFWPDVPRYPPDAARARAILQSLGLEDRNGNGIVEDGAGTEARFTVITQGGVTASERGTAVLREQLAAVGIALDIAPLEFGAMIQRMLACDYDAIYMRPLATDLDPAGNLDMWLSSGSAHFWNLSQTMPATDWERRMDTIMLEQAATLDPDRRRDLFNDVQRIFAEELPALYFAAPRIYAAHSNRLVGVEPSVLRPTVLWSADTLSLRTE